MERSVRTQGILGAYADSERTSKPPFLAGRVDEAGDRLNVAN